MTCLPFTEVMASKPLVQMCQTVDSGWQEGSWQRSDYEGKCVGCVGPNTVGAGSVYTDAVSLGSSSGALPSEA